jgi:hypothetical protein
MQIGVMSTSTVNISMSRIRSTSSIAVDPFFPVAGSVSGFQVLEVVGYGDALGFDSTQEVLHHGVRVISKADLTRFVITGCDEERSRKGWEKVVEEKDEKMGEDFGFGHTFDRPIEAMNVTVVASSLVGLVLSHERNQFLGGPALGLEVIVVRSRGTSVHLINMSARSTPLQRNIHSP